MRQAGLFDANEDAKRAMRREEILLSSWDTWGWAGPSEGGECEIDTPIVPTEEGGMLYCYCERARLVAQRPDGKWIAIIDMPGDWHKNGRRLVLDRYDIGPPRRDIRAERMTANKRYPPKPGAYPLETQDTRSLSGCSAVKEDVSVSDADIFACIKRIS